MLQGLFSILFFFTSNNQDFLSQKFELLSSLSLQISTFSEDLQSHSLGLAFPQKYLEKTWLDKVFQGLNAENILYWDYFYWSNNPAQRWKTKQMQEITTKMLHILYTYPKQHQLAVNASWNELVISEFTNSWALYKNYHIKKIDFIGTGGNVFLQQSRDKGYDCFDTLIPVTWIQDPPGVLTFPDPYDFRIKSQSRFGEFWQNLNKLYQKDRFFAYELGKYDNFFDQCTRSGELVFYRFWDLYYFQVRNDFFEPSDWDRLALLNTIVIDLK